MTKKISIIKLPSSNFSTNASVNSLFYLDDKDENNLNLNFCAGDLIINDDLYNNLLISNLDNLFGKKILNEMRK